MHVSFLKLRLNLTVLNLNYEQIDVRCHFLGGIVLWA